MFTVTYTGRSTEAVLRLMGYDLAQNWDRLKGTEEVKGKTRKNYVAKTVFFHYEIRMR